MIKDNNLIIGSGVLGAYLAKVLIKKKKKCYCYFKNKNIFKLQKIKNIQKY